MFRTQPQKGQQPAEEAYNEVELEQTTIPASTAEPPPHRSLLSLGLSDDIWRYHRELALECLRQMAPQDPRHKAIPPPYTNPFCLDDLHPTNNHNKHTSTSLGGQTYQVVNRDDGFLYCLRRFENIRSVSNPLCQQVLDRWNVNGISDHPGILNLEQCFVAQRALFVVHAYQPGATSLSHSQWQQRSSHGQGGIQCMPEPIVWSCVVQLVSILRRIHSLNLAVRCLDAAHVLVSMDASQLRFRFHVNCVGVMDLLDASNNSRKSMADHQWDDLRSLGRLLLGLATATKIHSSNEERRAEQYLQQRCSPELQELILTLCQSPHPPTAMELARALAGRALDELDAVHLSLDRTQQQLRGEYESGRAMRLLLKLGMVNERPELGMNRRWASSGDAYLLSLFRDYGALVLYLLLCFLEYHLKSLFADCSFCLIRLVCSLSSSRW